MVSQLLVERHGRRKARRYNLALAVIGSFFRARKATPS